LRLSAVTPSSVSQEDDDDAIVLFHRGRERRARRNGDGAPDDRGGARHADGFIDQVHRATPRAHAAVDAAMHFAQHSPQIASLGEISAVRTMARVHQIGLAKRRAAADRGRLLADDKVNRRLHQILVIAALNLLFDSADAQHRPVPRGELLGRMRVDDAVEPGEPVTLVGIADGHRPFG
jgi:hypothetical protein